MKDLYALKVTAAIKSRSVLTLVAFAVFMLAGISGAKAQDKIVLKDGKEIRAKILSADEPYVKYKRFDNLSGPDYYLYKTDVLRLEYEKNNGLEPLKLSAQTDNTINKEITELDLQLLEKKAKLYKKKSLISFTIGTAALVGGVATFVSLSGKYNDYKAGVRATNDEYIAWYRSSYDSDPANSELAKTKGFASFASPGIYIGAAALAGGIAFEMLGIRNMLISRRIRKELQEKKKQLSVQPILLNAGKTGGVRVAFQF